MSKSGRPKNSLVIEHMEGINREAIKRYPDIVTEFVRRKSGVFAPYKGNALYYVGLAKNLKSRLGERDSRRGLSRRRSAKNCVDTNPGLWIYSFHRGRGIIMRTATIEISGMDESGAKAALEKLRKQARVPDFK